MCDSVAKNEMANSVHQEPVLPTEVWERIFLNLDARNLKRIRLTCRRWRDIVSGCPQLIDLLPLTLNGDGDDDDDEDASFDADDLNLKPIYQEMLLNIKKYQDFIRTASRVTFKGPLGFDPVAVGWWPCPALGERLTHLKVVQFRIELSDLLHSLGATPNLRNFTLSDCRLSLDKMEDFSWVRLDKMEHFRLEYEGSGVEYLPVFGAIFPRLKAYTYRNTLLVQEQRKANVTTFIESVQDCLEEINLRGEEYNRFELANIQRLKLKRVVDFPWKDAAGAVEFCQHQKTIEELNILRLNLTNQELCEIGHCLPGLKRLQCRIYDIGDALSFMSSMPGLKYLNMTHLARSNNSTTFVEYLNSNLTDITLTRALFAPGRLQSLFRGLPNITTIYLHSCSCYSLEEFFSTLGQLKQLRQLKLFGLFIQNKENGCPCVAPLSELEELTVSQYDEDDGDGDNLTAMAALLQKCPQLRTLAMKGFNIDDDQLLQAIFQNVQLKMLTISTEHVSYYKATLDTIREHCREFGISWGGNNFKY